MTTDWTPVGSPWLLWLTLLDVELDCLVLAALYAQPPAQKRTTLTINLAREGNTLHARRQQVDGVLQGLSWSNDPWGDGGVIMRG